MLHKRRADGRLKAVITVGIGPDGKPVKKQILARTERELQKKIEDVRLALRTGSFADPGRMNLSEFLDMWSEKHVSKQEPKTREFYGHMVTHIKDVIGAVKLKDLTPLHVENLLDHYRDQVSGTTLHHLFSTLRAALNKGRRWRLIAGENPCEGVEPPSRSTKRCKPLDQEEIRKLLAAARKSRLFCLYLLAVWTGMREGELLGLFWSDIDFKNGWLRVQRSLEGCKSGRPIFGDPKTETSERDIPLSPVLLEALTAHRSHQQVLERIEAGSEWTDYGLVFTQRNGGPLNPSNLRHRYWYPLLKKAGLRRIKFHDLRHTAATVMLTDLGYDIKTVQEILGHTEARTTLDIYGHGRDAKKQEAVRRMDTLLTASGHE